VGQDRVGLADRGAGPADREAPVVRDQDRVGQDRDHPMVLRFSKLSNLATD
jgi:hypothetical protein